MLVPFEWVRSQKVGIEAIIEVLNKDSKRFFRANSAHPTRVHIITRDAVITH
jgi:hypothetical protein